MDDKVVIALIVAEVVRRQPMDTPTEQLVRVALHTEAKIETAITSLRAELAIVARSK